METKAGDPGAFAHFDLYRVPSPAFVVDEAALRRNLAILADVKARSGAKILCAMKAFSMWKVAPIIGEYLDGVCSSGLWESRLARDYYKGEIATYCAGYKEADMAEIVEISDHVIFNSPSQHKRFAAFLNDSVDVGLRLNPEHAEGEVAKYDPCSPGSRLGFPVSQLKPEHLEGVSGLHFHTLCEQDFEPLKRTWEALKPQIAPYFGQLRWLNFGGGHHITRADYQRDDLVAFIQQVRAETGLDPAHPGWAASPVYNLGLSNASIYEIRRYFEHACALADVRQVVVLLDFASFLAGGTVAPDFLEDRLAILPDGSPGAGSGGAI